MRPQELGIGRLFHNIRDAAIVAEASTGRIVLWNSAATEIFGYSASEALELNIEALVPDHLKEHHRAGLARYQKTGHGPYIDSQALLDLPAVPKNGGEISIEMSLSPIEPLLSLPERGHFVLAIIRDITERKRAEKQVEQLNENLEQLVSERTAQLEEVRAELEESEERFRSLVKHASDLIAVFDADGTIRYTSPSVKRILGYRPRELVGEECFEYVHPEDRELMRWAFAEHSARPGRNPSLEFRARHADGSWRYLEAIANNLLDNPGVKGIVVNARDVTERKQNEEDLRRSRDQLKVVLEGVADGITAQDTSGRLIYANEAAAKIFGYSSVQTLLETPVARLMENLEITDENGDPFPVERLPGRTAIRERRSVEVPLRFRNRQTGEYRWTEVRSTPILDERGDPQFEVNIFHDITERKEADEALRRAREAEQLRIAGDLHDTVLQDVAHAIQVLEIEQVRAQARGEGTELRVGEVAEILRRAIEGLRSSVFELRLQGEANSSSVSLIEALVDLNRRMARGRFTLGLAVEEGLVQRLSETVRAELIKILQEALSNARRHSGASHVQVSLKIEDDHLCMEVSDNGGGFETLDSGAGLGIASMQRRARRLGGELQIESGPGSGTCVRFRAPAERQKADYSF